MSHSLSLIFALMALRSGGWTPETYEVLFTNPVCPRQRFVAWRPRNPEPQSLISSSGPVLISPERDTVSEIFVTDQGIPTLGGGFRQTIPVNIYCDQTDFETSSQRAVDNLYRKTDSPINRVQDWIQSTTSGDEIFLSPLSV